MRSVPSSLRAHALNGSSHLVQAVKIIRKDGTESRWTEADIDGTVGGETYTSGSSLTLGSCPYGLDGFSSGLDLVFGTDDTTPISGDDIRDGVYDAAVVEVYEYDALNTSYGAVYRFWGHVANVTRRREGGTTVSCKGLLAQSHQIVVERRMPECIWKFCDSRCGLDPASYTFTGTITAITDAFNFVVSGDIAGRPDGVFKDGVFEFTSGDRAGVWGIELQDSTGGNLKSFLSLPKGAAVGDTISALQGCRKIRGSADGSQVATCKYYGNYARYGGYPNAGSAADSNSITFSEWPTV